MSRIMNGRLFLWIPIRWMLFLQIIMMSIMLSTMIGFGDIFVLSASSRNGGVSSTSSLCFCAVAAGTTDRTNHPSSPLSQYRQPQQSSQPNGSQSERVSMAAAVAAAAAAVSSNTAATAALSTGTAAATATTARSAQRRGFFSLARRRHYRNLDKISSPMQMTSSALWANPLDMESSSSSSEEEKESDASSLSSMASPSLVSPPPMTTMIRDAGFLDLSDLWSMLQSSPTQGLTSDEVTRRLQYYGPNVLTQAPSKSLWKLVLEQFEDRLVQILLVVAVLSAVFSVGEVYQSTAADTTAWWKSFVEPVVILAILVLNAVVGVVQSQSATDSLQALRDLQAGTATVLRDEGTTMTVAAAELVPGDVIQLSVGDKIPADVRLIDTPNQNAVQVDESSLTGESVTVSKLPGVLGQTTIPNASLADQKGLLYSGTMVTAGRGTALVIQTGMETQFGQIQKGVTAAQAEVIKTPLTMRLDEFGNQLTMLIAAICCLVWIVSIPKMNDSSFDGNFGQGALYYAKVAVALGVAAIPEGLPAVITLCLSLGTQQMAARNVIVRKLPSVETLGCTTVICTDKTGTLTTNEMTAVTLVLLEAAENNITTELQEEEQQQQQRPRRRKDNKKHTTTTGSLLLMEHAIEGVSYSPLGTINGIARNDEIQSNPTGALADVAAISALCSDAKIVGQQQQQPQQQPEEDKEEYGPPSSSSSTSSSKTKKKKKYEKLFERIGEPTEAALCVLAEKIGGLSSLHFPTTATTTTMNETSGFDDDVVNDDDGHDDDENRLARWSSQLASANVDLWRERRPRLATLEFNRDRKSMSVLCQFPRSMDLQTPATNVVDEQQEEDARALVPFDEADALRRSRNLKFFPQLPFVGRRANSNSNNNTSKDTQKKKKTKKELAAAKEAAIISRLLVKGAPNLLIERCTHMKQRDGTVVPLTGPLRRQVMDKVSEMAARPLRCLALAVKEHDDLEESLQRLTTTNYHQNNNNNNAAAESSSSSPQSLNDHPLLSHPENFKNIESGLTLVGIVGIKDPPRPEVASSIQLCAEAGIRIIMITGDARDTAVAIAKEVNIFPCDDTAVDKNDNIKAFEGREFFQKPEREQLELLKTGNLVFCRAEPTDKQKLVKMLQSLKEVPAMTGDGVNDAPALQQAAIGIAMGITGTEVSKEAADMILADDNFATIVSAVEEGRRIYANMQAFICFLISCNIGEICAILFATLAGFPEPLTAMHLLWVNLVTDGPPATALGFNPPSPNLMQQPPRPSDEPILTRWLLTRYCLTGLYVGIATIGVFAQYYDAQGVSLRDLASWSQCGEMWQPPTSSGLTCVELFQGHGRMLPQTLSLTTLVCMEMLKALSAVSVESSLLQVGPQSNPWLLLGVAGPLCLHLFVLYSPYFGLPALAESLGMVPLSWSDWLAVAAWALPIILVDEILKAIGRWLSSRNSHDFLLDGSEVTTTVQQ